MMCQRGGCSPKGVDMRWCASKDAGPEGGGFGEGPTSIGERNECQQGHWALKGSGLGGERNTLYKGGSLSLADVF